MDLVGLVDKISRYGDASAASSSVSRSRATVTIVAPRLRRADGVDLDTSNGLDQLGTGSTAPDSTISMVDALTAKWVDKMRKRVIALEMGSPRATSGVGVRWRKNAPLAFGRSR